MARTARPPVKVHTVAYDVPNPINEVPKTSTAGKPRNGELGVRLMGSGTELARDGVDVERYNRMNPESKAPRTPYIISLLEARQGPAIVSTDFIRAYPEQVRAYMPTGHYTVLGIDGFGRSDTRANLRWHFEVVRFHIAHAAIAAIAALAAEGKMAAKDVARAIKEYKIETDKPIRSWCDRRDTGIETPCRRFDSLLSHLLVAM